MIYYSLTFIFLFLPIVLIVYNIVPKILRNIILLLFNIVFLCWNKPIYICIILFSIIYNYVSGLLICKSQTNNHSFLSKFILIMSITLNIGLLFMFKYSSTLVSYINSLLSTNIPLCNHLCPVGMSIFTLQAISYNIDVFRKKAPVSHNIVDLGCFITFFPLMLVGPLPLYRDFEPALKKRTLDFKTFRYGFKRLIIGLFKIFVIAGNLEYLWKQVASTETYNLSVLTAWLGILAFTFLIYFYLTGYSDISIGIARMLGFNLSENFKHPYSATSITDFWKRWHISLVGWIKEYILNPFNNRQRSAFKIIVSFSFFLLLIGIWYGSGINYILWALYSALLLIIEKVFWGKYLKKLPALFTHIYTLFFVIVGWAIFAFDNIGYMISYIKVMFGFSCDGFVNYNFIYHFMTNIVIIIICILATIKFIHYRWYKNLRNHMNHGLYWLQCILLLIMFMISGCYMFIRTYNTCNESASQADFSIDSLVSGDFSISLEKSIVDKLPINNSIIKADTAFQLLIGRREINGVYICDNNYMINSWLPSDYNSSQFESNIAALNQFSNEHSTITTSVMIVPTISSINPEKLPLGAINVNENILLDTIYSELSTTINAVDTRENLLNHSNEYLYYKTDSRWTSLGAYYAYESWCKTGSDSPDLDNYRITNVTNAYTGNLSSKIINFNSITDKIDLYYDKDAPYYNIAYDYGTSESNSIYDMNALLGNNKYDVFLEGNHSEISIHTNVKNGKNLLVIKDSYANSYIPFLLSLYENLHIIDINYFEQNVSSYITTHNITDSLILYNIKDFAQSTCFTNINSAPINNETVSDTYINNDSSLTIEPITKEYSKYVFVGDSRYVGMSKVADPSSNDTFICMNGMGHNYLVEQMNNIILACNSNTALIIGLGVNDLNYNASAYIQTINNMASTLNCDIYYMLVNPVDELKEQGTGYTVTNQRIEAFNEKLKNGLVSSIKIIDTNSYLIKNGFVTVDGLHYNPETYKKIYDYIKKELGNK